MASNRGAVIWLTGLPSAGKTTLAGSLSALCLRDGSAPVALLDGDALRDCFGSPGFSAHGRRLSVLRAAVHAAIHVESTSGGVAVVALVSPFEELRREARAIVEASTPFFLVHVSTSPAQCAKWDAKGLWARAKAGELKGLTGHDAPYEAPEKPEFVYDAAEETPVAGAARIAAQVLERLA